MSTITELRNLLKNLSQEEYETETKASYMDYQKSKNRAVKLKITGLEQQLIREAHNTETRKKAEQIQESREVKEKITLIEELAEMMTEAPAKMNINQLPSDIKPEIEADIEEMQKCIANECLRSAVILCGRVLETALHRKYYEVTGVDLLEKAPGTGLGNLIAKLSQNGVKVDPGLMNQIHLVNQVRVHSVHKKQQLFMPSKQQTQAIVLYTQDILEKLFNQANS